MSRKLALCLQNNIFNDISGAGTHSAKKKLSSKPGCF